MDVLEIGQSCGDPAGGGSDVSLRRPKMIPIGIIGVKNGV